MLASSIQEIAADLRRLHQDQNQLTHNTDKQRGDTQIILDRLSTAFNTLSSIDGRTQNLPQLISAELRANLAEAHTKQQDAIRQLLAGIYTRASAILLVCGLILILMVMLTLRA